MSECVALSRPACPHGRLSRPCRECELAVVARCTVALAILRAQFEQANASLKAAATAAMGYALSDPLPFRRRDGET